MKRREAGSAGRSDERRRANTAVTTTDPGGPAAMLVVVHGEETGRRVALGGEPLVLGRGTGADVRLVDPVAARAHARVALENGQWVVRDLASPAGTYVNDLLVGEYVLRDGDRVRVGRTILKLLAGGDLEARCAEEMFRVQTVDGLTLAANRASFEEALSREVGRARRFGQALSLVLLDVDGFRRLNQTRGEAVGNAVLQRLAAGLKGVMRRQDVFARIDDDEFAVVLPGFEAADAQLAAEKLCQVAAAGALPLEDGPVSVTVSAGFARLRSKEDARQLAARAGKALLRAQASGGNRVEDASPWVPTSVAGGPGQPAGRA